MSTFESEIGFFTVFLIIVLASVYIWTSYNAIELNKNCSSNSVNISKKYKDLEKYLKYAMTVAVSIPAGMFLMKLVQNEAILFTIIYSLFGIISAAIAMDILKNPDCESVYTDEKKEQGWITLGAFISVFVLACIYGFYKRSKY